MASLNGDRPDLGEVVASIKRLTVRLLVEYEHERREACWPSRRSSPLEGAVRRSGPGDPTFHTTAHPDPTNTARADECERAIRRAYGMLEDFTRRLKEPTPPPPAKGWCGTCRLAPVHCKGECAACGAHRRRHGDRRPAHLIERARRRAEKAEVRG